VKKAGYIAIVGRPNAGKSTFLNQFLGENLSITTHKAQTTRDKILGVFTEDNLQIIFLDSPGLHIRKKEINLFMIKEAISAIKEADVVLLFVEYNHQKKIDVVEEKIIEHISKREKPIILILNKIDKFKNPMELMEAINFWNKQGKFDDIIPISSLKGFNKKLLIKDFKKYIPEHPFYYPEDYLTDKDERFTIAELIREQILLMINEEIPYDTAVRVEKFATIDGKLHLEVTVILARESQKRVVIGSKGEMLQKIKDRASKTITEALNKDVHLRLFVRVEKNWNKIGKKMEEFGYKNSINIDNFLK